MNDDLNKILNRQRIIPPSTNLSARIIAAVAIKKETHFWIIVMEEVNAMFFIPRPTYALAFSLIIGVVLGLQNEMVQILSATDQAQDVFSFLQVDANITEGDWL